MIGTNIPRQREQMAIRSSQCPRVDVWPTWLGPQVVHHTTELRTVVSDQPFEGTVRSESDLLMRSGDAEVAKHCGITEGSLEEIVPMCTSSIMGSALAGSLPGTSENKVNKDNNVCQYQPKPQGCPVIVPPKARSDLESADRFYSSSDWSSDESQGMASPSRA
ncbi:hypothetical protein NDU88_004800 [Pleurodeles waltl]|uniref:Uncharacterized protein n=1 Tax=Pleurodeles waltl TaxID=8319 RepID=A0AAV7VJR2_PLEWA|nr:hypothetical protein NDU88_004800 [Pleurodeles waltl]